MKSTNTFGIHFILRHQREKEGKSPVYARIVVNKTRCELALKVYIQKSDWNAQKGAVKPKTLELKKLNNHLEETRAKIVTHYMQLEKD